jgi:LacI family transcriptional regulator
MGYERIGYEAGRLLDSLMQAKDRKKKPPDKPPHVFVPPSHVDVRESTDFFVVEDPVVADAIAFIAANSTKAIGQDDVAKAVSTETRTLQSRFRKALGKPIAATIRLLRLERAKRELLEGDRPTKAIARSSGFGTAANMNNCFLKELGMTPTEFRRQRKVRPGKPGR